MWEPGDERLVDFTDIGDEVWVTEGTLLGLPVEIVSVKRGSLNSHYEISPREREDEQLRDERDFGTQEYDDEADKSEPRVWGDSAES